MNHSNSGLAHGTNGSPQLTVENWEMAARAKANEEKVSKTYSEDRNFTMISNDEIRGYSYPSRNMIKKIRLMLDYGCYPVWLYDENDKIIDNGNPPEWDDDQELTNAFMAVSDLYDTFFVDNDKEFSYIGYPDEDTACRFRQLFSKAFNILVQKNAGKYIIQNDVDLENL